MPTFRWKIAPTVHTSLSVKELNRQSVFTEFEQCLPRTPTPPSHHHPLDKQLSPDSGLELPVCLWGEVAHSGVLGLKGWHPLYFWLPSPPRVLGLVYITGRCEAVWPPQVWRGGQNQKGTRWQENQRL